MTSTKYNIKRLLTLVKLRYDHPLSTITNLRGLSTKIKASTGENLSVSTLRRLFGMVESNHESSISTLDILSRFVGYRGWRDYVAHDGDDSSQSKFLNEQVLRCDVLVAGDVVEVEWPPARLCRLKSLGGCRFEVLLSINSKLAEGDTLCVQVMCVGQPMVATNVVRGNRRESVYIAGRIDGISVLRVMHAV